MTKDKIPDSTVTDELKRLSRRVEEVSKTVELQYKDRDILEDILNRLGAVETALHMNREHQTEMQKETTANIKKVEFSVEDKVAEVKDSITDKTIMVTAKNQNILGKIQKMIGGVK